ncbi:MAG: NADH-quinone oxidoreductase subunit J [Verrucomicrobiae bacterium]|nr:NADH-quinone oxidoreductase subunit J [Verrucomicrobiae bacterium]
MHDWLFWVFSIAMLLCGIGVITSRNPVNSAMLLVVLFFFMAGLFVLLEAYFLAIIQILVYAGAVMVLFLFIVMLLDIKAEQKRHFRWAAVVGGLILTGLLINELSKIIGGMPGGVRSTLQGKTEDVGRLLFTDYLLPFEITSLILLVAMVGVILLSRKETT